ncbi:NAD(+) diphosphatase [Microbacterium marinilacus]|uniref:NAD(+) diphosphatase n=1 Tax=Microbacterium marinilacus TaxID=415209 RepID=A0ABP7B683_9MICO|nr:NAD(+) diphosphatase [Microbacterium marinilacus]MBY0687525.1 NAD(+) diphosphatase [Microbacterium marinilacus]
MTRSPAVAVSDLAASERDTPGLIDDLRAQPTTLVVVVRGDRAPRAAGADTHLHAIPPADVPDGAEWGLLGRAADGAAVLVAAFAPTEPEPLESPGGWAALREVGGELAQDEADTLVAALSLGRWLTGHRFCPVCGASAELRQAGWSRRCTSCGREHFPRNDPAVIVAITDPQRRRLLLGANASWGGRMHSCFAGFVEAGESLERAIHREMLEEAGVRVSALRYRRSQSWPYPHSLMLGFDAVAVDPDEARPDGEEIVALRWFTRDEIGAALAGRGDTALPGPASIAHLLIRQWHDEGDA